MVIRSMEQILKTAGAAMDEDIVDLNLSSEEEDEDEEEESEEEDDLYYKVEGALPYEGQVKTLVKMYETFAKNMATAKPKINKHHTFRAATATTAGPSSATGGSVTTGVVPSLEQRLQSVEAGMAATVSFVTDLVNLKLDILDTTIKHQVSMEKNFKALQSKTNDLDEEMDVYQDHEHFLGGAITALRKDYGKMLLQVTKLEQTFTSLKTDIQNVNMEVYKTSDMVSDLVEKLKTCRCSKKSELENKM